MKFALISDIHANAEALEAVLADIKTKQVDEIICLGDIVGYGANPNECIELVKKSCSLVLLGNHDAAAVGLLSTQHFNIHAKIAIDWTEANLQDTGKAYLKTLPLKENKNSNTLTLVHATPYEPNMWYYITSLEEAAFNFQFFETSFCFVGHTHIPIVIVLEHEKEVYVHQGETLDYGGLDNVRFLINVGSVGQPRDRNSKSCYGIIDSDARTFTYHRVAYDVQKAQAKMRKIKMPEFLITRLEEGR